MEGLPADPAVRAGDGRGRQGSRGDTLSTRRLILWRHGQTVWNLEKRFQGQSDIPLDETGERQAERAARLLAALRPDLIVSSDLRRATGTAAPLSRLTGLLVTADKDLRERYGGVWEGLSDKEIRERYPEAHATWTPPEGESSAAVGERVCGALERVAANLPDDGLAVVVSHGAAIRLGMARLLGMPEELWGALGPLANCAWSLIGMGWTRWRVLEHNAGTLPEPVLGDDR